MESNTTTPTSTSEVPVSTTSSAQPLVTSSKGLQTPRPGEIGFPPICFSTCESAFQEASSTGLTPPLCSPSSLFTTLLTSCTSCISTRSPQPSAVLSTYINPRFAPYINYCAIEFSQPVLGTGLPITTIPLVATQVSASVDSIWSEVGKIASSNSYYVVPTELLVVSTQTRTWTSTGQDGNVKIGEDTRTVALPNWSAWGVNGSYPGGGAPVGSGTPSPGGSGRGVEMIDPGKTGEEGEGGRNMTWVAGPVLGCLVGIGMVVAGGWIWMRRRRRGKGKGEMGGPLGEDPLGKAQLHSECVARPMTPREMDGGRKTFWQMDEMAANEVPAAELPGDEGVWADEKVRPESGSTFDETRKV